MPPPVGAARQIEFDADEARRGRGEGLLGQQQLGGRLGDGLHGASFPAAVVRETTNIAFLFTN
jgi:hypothetical protein